MKKPIIGVVPLYDDEKESLWMLPGYMDGIVDAGEYVISVNSYHHQAVKDVADELKVMAVSEDGLVEAVELPEKRFVWAVQWHPEFSYRVDDNSKLIFREFVKHCQEL